MRRRHLLAGLAGLPTAAFIGPGILTRPTGGQLDDLLVAVHVAGIPGTFAEVGEGGATYRPAAGVADLTSGRPAQPQSYHRVGGITKSFVAVVVLQMVGERRIQLDAPIARYLPGVVPGERGRQVTVRMLLNHTSGIADFMVTNLTGSTGQDDGTVLFGTRESIAATARRQFRPEELVRIGLARAQPGPPGSTWSYASTNYVILGLLIERITGHTYEQEVTRRVLAPLGLRHSYLPGRARGLRGPHLRAYVPWDGATVRDMTIYDMSWAWASCDLISTAGDLNRFYRALLGGRVLPPALLREMMTTVPMSAAFPDFAGYGLGLFWLAGACGRTWGHDGLAIGHTTYSRHTEDGRTVQLTLAENLNFYESAAQSRQGTHPIDVARNQFESTVLSVCETADSPVRASAFSGTHPLWSRW